MSFAAYSRCQCGAKVSMKNQICPQCWDSLWWQAIDLSMKGRLQTPVTTALSKSNRQPKSSVMPSRRF
jgi:uncharacterized OB-fold protein